MKTIILTSLAFTCCFGAFAQGVVIFNNRIIGTLITHVYQPLPSNPFFHQIGNGSDDTPSGSTDWLGFSKVGLNLNGQFGGSTTFATLLSLNGANQPESSLLSASQTTTFRTGGGAGNVFGITATLNNVPQDSPAATLEMVAWDNSSGLYSTWNLASVAWKAGIIAAGGSGPLTVQQIGGQTFPAPTLFGMQSFNLYIIPEPSTLALFGLGVSSLMLLRKRRA